MDLAGATSQSGRSFEKEKLLVRFLDTTIERGKIYSSHRLFLLRLSGGEFFVSISEAGRIFLTACAGGGSSATPYELLTFQRNPDFPISHFGRRSRRGGEIDLWY